MNTSNSSVTNSTVLGITNSTLSTLELIVIPYVEVFLTLFVLIDVVAITGNILVILTIYYNMHMRSTIYILLLNLSLTDLSFGLLAPVHVHSLVNHAEWNLGDAFCRVYYFFFRVLYAFSVLILELITCERFLAVMYPFTFKPNTKRAVVILLVLFVCSLALSSPFLFVQETVFFNGQWFCTQYGWYTRYSGKEIYYALIYTLLYVCPVVIMTIMYSIIAYKLAKSAQNGLQSDSSCRKSRPMVSRKRMSKLVFMVILGFFLCWTPYCIIEFIETVLNQVFPPRLIAVKFYLMIPVFFSSALNVFLYSFLSQEFRNGFGFVFGKFLKPFGYKAQPTIKQKDTVKTTLKLTSRRNTGNVNC